MSAEADGVGFEEARVPALKRLRDTTSATIDRYCEQLGDIAMRLEAESLG